MKRFKSYIVLFSSCLLLCSWKPNIKVDSTVVFGRNGDSTVHYYCNPVVFDIPQDSKKPISLITTDAEKEAMMASMISEAKARAESVIRSGSLSLPDTNSFVGGIPVEEGISASGARTYTVPIMTAPDARLAPSISLVYNGQATEGLAGYGWDVSGISRISLINKNIYYHDQPGAAKSLDTDAVFALDGMPLVQNDDSSTMLEYGLVTATGHIIVKKETNAAGYITGFQVRYPNGTKATYSLGYNVNNNFPSYPITELRDLDGHKIVFSYIQNSSSGDYKISSISYNYTPGGSASSSISFYYSIDNTTGPSKYYAGKSVDYTYRLNKVTSSSHGGTLARYNLRHTFRDNVYLLTQIGCTNGTDSLPPLNFDYGELNYWYSGLTSTLEKSQYPFQYLTTAFTDGECIFRRGKFARNCYNDGLVIYPDIPNYSIQCQEYVLFQGYTYQYGSLVSNNQSILFVPYLSDGADGLVNQVNSSVVAESGFQTMEAVDVDGDGLDELVKVNVTAASGTLTTLKFSAYKCNNSGAPSLAWTSNVQINGTITSGRFTSPYQRAYYWGDFTGAGKAQMLALSYAQNLFGIGQTSYAALVDIAGGTVLSDEVVFPFSLSDARNVLVMDIDSDGRSELCHATANGFDIYRLNSTNHFALEESYSSLTALSSGRTYYTDLNADGYLDVMWHPGGTSSVFYRHAYTGEGFVTSLMNFGTIGDDDKLMFIDVNEDRYPDVVRVCPDGSMGVNMNINGRFYESFRQSTSTVTDTKGILPCNVMDYGATSCFIKVEGFYIYRFNYFRSPKARYLTQSTDSFGRTIYNSYEYLPNKVRYWTTEGYSPTASAGYIKMTLPIYVLGSDQSYLNDGTCGPSNSLYSYYDAVVHNRGLGFCGFARIKKFYYPTQSIQLSDTRFNPEKRGVATQTDIRDGATETSPLVRSVINTYDNHSTIYGKLNPRLTQSVVTDSLSTVVTTTAYTYDSYDYVTRSATMRQLSGSSVKKETRDWSYQHSTDTDKYVLGVVTNSAVTRGHGIMSLQWSDRSDYIYDQKCHLVKKEDYTGLYGTQGSHSFYADNKVLETRWQYDTLGNVITEKKAQYSSQTFVGDSLTYDINGQFVKSRTNALGQTTIYLTHNRLGMPILMRDYRGRFIQNQYDSWGNLLQSTHVDGTVEQTTRRWGGKGRYKVIKTVTGTSDHVFHYDGLGREIRTGNRRFDGTWQYVDREYDAYGNLDRVSLPYKGSAPSYWNQYTYDHFARLLGVHEASGRNSTWSYSGTSVTKVIDGITSTSTRDANGNVVSVTDPGGTITYTLRDDGQPSTITAPGNIKTTITYDSWGRRKKIVDPSAGTQTDTYGWNADGTSNITHTNPNGTIVTRRDKYGRTILVERPGTDSTMYVYNTYGLLTGEITTNGTRKDYTYDNNDRLTSVKEIVPDGKWLQQSITYAVGKQVSSIQYKTHNGVISTETFNYANNNNTGVTLSDGTAVRNLVSENDLGQPTEITTGTINRQYGYSRYGVPKFRKMADGNLQNESYLITASTGNLRTRRDSLHNRRELFQYDDMNRLTRMNAHQVTYADNGNITSIAGIGNMAYDDSSHPYRITSFTPVNDTLVSHARQTITYTSQNRPSTISENGITATFTYNADGERVKMSVADSTGVILTRYYIGGRYECDVTPTETKERLYLDGDAYSAPMVYQRVGTGAWSAYNIGRDYLGSITQIATSNGTFVAEYSYDPWGSPSNPDLFLGRGFTGHEHLPWFGLINMNARLYDPLIGRFLSPDPYIQATDFIQNFNRYSYALNNPLKYRDQNGEFVFTTAMIVGIAVGAVVGIISGYLIGQKHNAQGWEMAGYIIGGGLIGGVAGFAGGAVGSAVSSLAASAGYGGFAAGAAAGGLAGVTSGFINGTGYSLLDGNSFGDAVYSGGISALIGGASGAVIGGVIQGIQASKAGNSFWTGRAKVSSSYGVELGHHGSLEGNPAKLNEPISRNPSDLSNSSRYDLSLKPDEPTVTLYRGTTGTEYGGKNLFMTDNLEYAAQYIRNGGELVKVTLPKFSLQMMLENGDAFMHSGYYMPPSDISTSYIPHTEYEFMSWLKPWIVRLFTPL